MDTTFTENDKQYEIVNGRVASANYVEKLEALKDKLDKETEKIMGLTLDDRVVVGKKFGSIVGIIDTVYGKTAAIKLDDGSVTELLLENLVRAPVEKVAATSADTFEAEYEAYLAMDTDTSEELELKVDKARELNLRAKAFQTNSKNSLSDQILYDRVITATYVDVQDLKDAAQILAATEDNYLERLPKFELSETIHRGGNSDGDASWLSVVADEIEPEIVDEAVLVDRATKVVASYSNEQLEDDAFMRAVLSYAFETVSPEDKTKFAAAIAEAKAQKLATPVENTRTASTFDGVERDLDGNEINLDDVPFEAIFG